MDRDLFKPRELKKELCRYSLNLHRGSSLESVKNRSLIELNIFKEKFFYISGKVFLTRVSKKEKFNSINKEEIVKLGKKYPSKIIFRKLLFQEKIRFHESGFINPSEKSKIYKKGNFYEIKTDIDLFPKVIKVENLNQIENKIVWPTINYNFPLNTPGDTHKIVNIVCDFLLSIGVARQGLMDENKKIIFRNEVERFIKKQEPIRISYYLFCGKIGNPAKVNRRRPNLADYYGLYKLVEIERKLRKFYQPVNSPFSVEWFIIDQTKIQRFDISLGQEVKTRQIYNAFIKRLGGEKFIHLVPWEDLITDKKEFQLETNRLRKIYNEDYLNYLINKDLAEVNRKRAERMLERIHSAYGIINPFTFTRARILLDDLLVIYNDFFPGLHFNVPNPTPFQKKLKQWVKRKAISESAQYLGSLEARTTAKNFAAEMPKVISATVTRKEGRYVIDYLGSGKVEGSRFFPDVGEAVVFPDKEITIMPYLTLISYPGKFTPVFVKEFGDKSPFFYISHDYKTGYF